MLYTGYNIEKPFTCGLRRALILCDPAAARLLSELLKDLGVGRVIVESTLAGALDVASAQGPDIIFCEGPSPGVDGLEFVRRLRRSNMACRKAPVIMVIAEATPSTILAARDAGVHEILRLPFTINDLVRRLEAVSTRPRGWVEGPHYAGPDRRQFNSAEFKGKARRRSDAKAIA